MANLVKPFYDENVALEDDRLDQGRLELAVILHTIRILAKELVAPGRSRLNIADVGCGTAPYAIQLARDGHNVWACDLSSGLVEQAKQNAQAASVKLNAMEVCDARRIRDCTKMYMSDFYDVSLLLGPMYHILDEAERAGVLESIVAMTKPGGYVVVTFVTQNAHLRDICTRDPERLSKYEAFYSGYINDGRYTRSKMGSMPHTTPSGIQNFPAAQQGRSLSFETVRLVSCEGFLGLQHASHLSKLDDVTFDKWLQVVLRTAEREETLGAADHIIAVLRKL